MGKREMAIQAGVAQILLLQLVISSSLVGVVNAQLNSTYYSTSCPRVFTIVDKLVFEAIQTSGRNIVGGLLRLNFHDCFVRGCDASVLIDSTPSNVAEKDSIANANSLRGFDIIDNVKSALEKACPGVVSCADVVALVARAGVFMIGGPSWSLPLGRRDGNTSIAEETIFNLPPPFAEYPQLVNMFAAKGLTQHDMVVLAGAHTIGNTHCNIIESRLYNSTGPGGVDPDLNATYAAQLKTVCPFSNGTSHTIIPLDPSLGGDTFDNHYYSNVIHHNGLFISDAALLKNSTGSRYVFEENIGPPTGPQYPFIADFAQAMTKMNFISPLLAPEGEVRLNCHVVNSQGPAPAPAPVPSSPTPAPAPVPVSEGPSPAPAPNSPTPAPGPAPVTNAPAPVPVAPAPAPNSPTPAPVPAPSSPTPTPTPVTTSPAQAPVPVTSPALAPAPVTSHPALAPVPVPSSAPAPAPHTTSLAPAPVPVSSLASAPVPVSSSAPAPVPVSSLASAPVPVSSSAPAPVPVSSLAAPVPVSSSAPAPVPVSSLAPAPVPVSSLASAPVPVSSSAPAPVPVSKSASAPAPHSSSVAPASVPVSRSPAPATAPVTSSPAPASAPVTGSAAPAPVPVASPVAPGPSPVSS